MKENDFAVIFDMDGVIFDSERAFKKCWKVIAAKYHIINIEMLCSECSGMNWKATKEWALKRYGADFPFDMYNSQVFTLFEELYGNGKLPLKAGVLEILTFLENHMIPTALASSSNQKMVLTELENAGITKYFSRIICGDMTAHSKPAPDIFLKAGREMGVNPQDTYVIEDSYNGIRAAYAGGFMPVMVPDLAEPTSEMEEYAVAVLPDLIKVREFLQEKLKK